MKRIKMLLYGEPGVGKSVFALGSPKPFFITTDGNYEFLDEFGAKEEDHVAVSSWEEMKVELNKDFDGYETIVVDLLEDAFKWCEQEYCIRSRIEHVSDQGYGKAYDATRNEFFIEIAKLLAKNKNVILIMHGYTYTIKDRRGVEHTRYAPSSRLPDKLLNQIEGRVRYCLRCYTSAEEEADGTITKKRYLSLVPKENEFGIIRGVDENKIPHDIPLDFPTFAKTIGIRTISPKTKPTEENKPIEKPNKIKEEMVEEIVETKLETSVEVSKLDDVKAKLAAIKAKKAETDVKTEAKTEVIEEPAKTKESTEVKVSENAPVVEPESIEEVSTQTEEVSTAELSTADKLANIKAKLAAIKAKK